MPRERRVPEDSADYARWLADRIEERGEHVSTRLSPAAAYFVAMALRGYARLLDGRETAEMLFTIGIEEGALSSLQASCRSSEAAWAAYHLIVVEFPSRKIVLRHSGRMLATHDPKSPATDASSRDPA